MPLKSRSAQQLISRIKGDSTMNRFVTISLCLLLFLSACGTLEISVDRTPTPNLGATAVVGTLQAQNAQLATQNATLNPISAALTMDSSSEIIRQKMQATSTFWQTIFVDGTITWYAPAGETAPAQVFHEQDWIDHPTHRFRVLLGPAGGAAETFKACDGVTILNIDLKSGQSQSNPLPKFAQDTSPVAGQDMLWGQIGTPLSEIALSTDYAATGGVFVPLKLETVAGRQTLVVDWTRADTNQHAFRAWLDVETGVILKLQEFGKGGGDTIQGERVVNQVVYNTGFADALFGPPSSPAQFSDVNGVPLTPTAQAPTPSTQADPLGQVYFFISDQKYGDETVKLVRLPGSCVVGQNACPQPEDVSTPSPLNFSLTPLVWSPDGKVAAYAYPGNKTGDKTDLFLFDPIKQSWTSLAEFNFIDPPMWSPDGNWLAFRVQDGQGNEDIYAIRRDGTGLTDLTASDKLSSDNRPYIADGWISGSVILRSGKPGTEGNVYLMNPQDGTVKSLFETLLIKSQFFPSPDGERLAYFEYSDNSPRRVLELVDAGGTTVHELFVFRDGSIYPVVWSPDGAKIAFMYAGDPSQTRQDVYMVNRDGTELSQVYRGMMVSTLAFSPDGKSLLIQDDDAAGRHIFVVDLATLEQHMLQAPDLPLDWVWLAPSWQP
jgi:WD40 repeat protein